MRHLDVKSCNQPLVLAKEIEESVSSRSTPWKGTIFEVGKGFGGATYMSRSQNTECSECELAGDENEMVHE
jgi:hypothetical protein